MKTTVDFTGSVSEATMRSRHLVPRFMAVLDHYWPERAQELRNTYPEVFEMLDQMTWEFDHDHDPEQHLPMLTGYLMESLFDALDEIAPEGCSFGASEGDGASYGYWTYEDE